MKNIQTQNSITQKKPEQFYKDETINSLLSAKDKKISYCTVQNSLYEQIEAPVHFLENGRTAIIETTKANGLTQIKDIENPGITSTYGVGQMIAYAADLGAKKIILILGESSTYDCGLGMLAALGACFYNKNGISFVPTGDTLKDVEEIDLSMMYPRLQGARFEAFSKEKNPLCKNNDSTYTFAQQKLKDKQFLKQLNEGILHISKLFNKMRTTDFSLTEGSGAAGGLGFAILAGLNGKLKII